MSSKKRIYSSVLFLLIFALAGNAYALKFNGDAWLGHHYENGNPTDEYFLVIDKTDLNKVKLKGFKFKDSSAEADFFGLTNRSGNDGLTSFEIDTAKSKKFKKFTKKAERKSKKLIKKGLLEEGDQQAWIDGFVNTKLEASLYKLIFKDEYGKYKAKIGYATFENPYPYSDDGGPNPGGGAAPVPEPTTLLLLGSGMLGLAAFRRKSK